LLELIAGEGVTVIHFVPSMLHLFLESADQQRCASLKHVVLSGEALTVDLQQRYFAILKAQLHNLYGPTEAAVDVTYWKCDPEVNGSRVPIGRPVSNTRLYILDKEGRLVPNGNSGELHIGGVQVARGYLNRPELTAEKFIPDPFSTDPSACLYKTGDLCRYLPDGNIDYLGRIDFQVKIRGNRIELGEIEATILKDSAVQQCAVTVREDSPGEIRLVAYIVEAAGQFSVTAMRNKLAEELPDYMIPAVFVLIPDLPLTPSGKTDRRALPKPGRERPKLANQFIAPRTEIEKKLARVWRQILKLDKVGIDDNFFELGGDSLMGLKTVSRLHSDHRIDLPVVKLFQYPSIEKLARYLDNGQGGIGIIDKVNERATRQRIGRFHNDLRQDGIAVIGMAGRFPGAATIDQLWDNLCNNVESISSFSCEELGPGLDKDLINDPNYVPARGIIEDADKFDAAFFGIGPQEAKVMDPQQRVFLELAWTALENAGYDSESFDGMIGVYAGVGDNHYYPLNVLSHPDLVNMVGKVIVGYGNEKDYIATRVSYALNLTGPSVSANTGCSTSLLAVDNAFRALIDFECDMALAGGVDIFVPQKSGFLYQPDGIFSKNGHCCPFDNTATGTMFCDGAGIVVLKRLTDALSDGDRIYAVLRGTAKNNDGSNKVSFLAPSVEGQAQVIAMAQAYANVLPEDISFIEAHGTGTPLGDPIEMEALTKVFRSQTDKKQYCRIGSIKGNIGHPTIASGVAGLIKAALSLYHAKIPATLNFQKPNVKIDFENSPFKVVDKLTPWPRSDRRRIAGVSSFGFGGTNVHTILEEPPLPQSSGLSGPRQLLLFSGKTEKALSRVVGNLKTFLEHNPDTDLADTAFTLQAGRRYFAHRRFAICSDVADAIDILENPDPMRSQARICEERDPEIVFMFPGQGSQYVNMGKNLYDDEPFFKDAVDSCCEILQPHLACDLREFLYPAEKDVEKARQSLENTFFTQPALFTIEYALARLLQHWGIRPSAMIGHSVGEFVCACLADVFALEDALRLVALRGRLIQDLPPGSMLALRGNADEIEPHLPANIQLAAANSPSLCVVSGPNDAIARYQNALEQEGVSCKPLHTSHAFHSAMMDPVVDTFAEEVSTVKLGKPKIPFVSTVTARWISDKEAASPGYWGRHMRMPVRFSHGIMQLLKIEGRLFLEVGPRTTCATLTRQHLTPQKKVPVAATLAETHADNAEWTALLSALGHLWLHGVSIDWQAFYAAEKRHRIPLPTYPFEHKSFWLDPLPRSSAGESAVGSETLRESVERQAISIEQQPSHGQKDALTSYIVSSIEETSGLNLKGLEPSLTFLELGMDSLLLSQLAYKLKSDFGVKIEFSHLMRKLSTIPLLVEYIRTHTLKKDTTKNTESEPPAMISGLDPGQEPVTVPVTVPQRGLWLSSNFCNELSCAYNESITLHLTGDIDITLLEKALYGLVQKHDALRAKFSGGGETMTISTEIALDLRWMDLGHMNAQAAREEITSIIGRDVATPLDLERGPLLRCHVITLPGKQCFVVLTSHHIVCDGWSLDVLISDLCIFYNTLYRGQELRFERMYRFADFAQMADTRLKSDEYRTARAYWMDRFKESFPVLQLPADHPQNRMGSYEAQRIDLNLSGEVVGSLKDVCKKKGWSLFTVFVAAYKMMLFRLTGQENFVIGLPTAEQPLIGQENLVGHCVNLVPLWCPTDTGMIYENFIDAVQQALFESYDHQIYTFVDLLNEEGIPFDQTGVSPLPAGLTTTKKYSTEDLHIDNMAVDYFANPRSHESFELYLNVVESATAFELKCHFKTALFDPQTIQAWLELYINTLEKIARDPKAQIDAPLCSRQIEQRQHRKAQIASDVDNDLIGRLLPIWQRVLGNSSIGPHDNFFDLGGQSLLAAKLFAEIENLLCKSIPLSALYKAPTVAKLAQIIEQQGSGCEWNSVVPINPDGSRPPLFLVHGAEGNILLYRDLAKCLGDDQPVYGIQSAGLNNGNEFDAHFETVAMNYLNAIKSHQSDGPYFIGGYCLGGTIALE
ncbi:MAG: acyltransferase domain-containing protein, partial [Desulfobacterales bacterium]|nr:acyltransferase domain-containing protein [Desulfobacterales bacterium]